MRAGQPPRDLRAPLRAPCHCVRACAILIDKRFLLGSVPQS